MKKPSKPYKDFPLFPHANGQWAKKINGRPFYFGRWEDGWQAALERYNREREALYAGINPETYFVGGCTVSDLCNLFLAAKDRLTRAGDLSQLTYNDYKATCDFVLAALSRNRSVSTLGPVDFDTLREKLAKTLGLVSLSNEINRIRVLFKYAYDADLIDRPVRFGPHFKRPSKRRIRMLRAKQTPKLFTGEEVRALINAAEGQFRAMILLGINCGLGNADCGRLEWTHLDLKKGWLSFPRPKTGVERRAKLWPETVKAISEACNRDNDLVFQTKYGNSWFKSDQDNPVSKEFCKLAKGLKMHKKGRGFYALRHTFATVASGCLDQVAVDHVMGHEPSHIGANYRHGVSDERLESVARFMLDWLPPEIGEQVSELVSEPKIIPIDFSRKSIRHNNLGR